MNTKLFAVATFAILASLCGFMVMEAQDNDAASYGTETNPVSTVNMTIDSIRTNYDSAIYIYNGGSFTLTGSSSIYAYSVGDSTYGISVSGQNFTGTVSKTGSFTLTYARPIGGVEAYGSITVNSIAQPTTKYTLTFSSNNSSYGSCNAYKWVGTDKVYITSGTQQEAGTTIYLTATPESGYKFSRWTSGGTLVSPLASYTLTMPSNDYSLVANFEVMPAADPVFTFSSNNSNYGSCNCYKIVSGQQIYVTSGTQQAAGTTLYMTAIPESGYEFLSYTSGGSSVSRDPYYTFAMPSSDYSLTAQFVEESKYTLNFAPNNANYGGTSGYRMIGTVPTYFNTGEQFSAGTELYVYASPSSGYHFVNWTVNGTEVSTSPTYQFNMPASNYTLVANFEEDKYQFTYSIDDSSHGSVRGFRYSGSQWLLVESGNSFAAGTQMKTKVYPATGYTFTGWLVNGSVVSTDIEYEFTMPASAYTVQATFETASYTISYSVNDSSYGSCNGYKYVDGQQVYFVTGTSQQAGTTLYMEAIPETGYTFSNWTSGSTVVSTSPTYQFNMPASNYTLVANFIETPKYTLNFAPNNVNYGETSGFREVGGVPVYFNSGMTFEAGTELNAYASPKTGYQFVNWTAGGTVVSTDPTYTFAMPSNNYSLVANFQEVPTYRFNFSSSDTNLGTVSGYRMMGTVPIYFNSGQSFEAGTELYAYASPRAGYMLSSWTVNGTVVSTDQTYAFTMPASSYTLVANFAVDPNYHAYWSNDLYNGNISLAFKFPGTDSMTHEMYIPLYSSTVDSSNRAVWTQTGDVLQISASYPATFTISINGQNPVTTSLGMWSAFVLELNLAGGVVNFTPIDWFDDFTSYSTVGSQTTPIFTWETDMTTALYIEHKDVGTGISHPRFSVVNTVTFLDTFGIVLNNPHLNVNDYFPQYSTVRVNLYSFAVYGDTMTVNGRTWDVEGSTITITYTQDEEGLFYYAEPGTDGSQTKVLTLSNIDITWDGTDCLLTFNGDNFTVNLGSYSSGSKTFSFTGLWYFTATVSEPYTATKTVVSGEWDSLLHVDSAVVVILFLGIVTIAGLICHAKFKLKWLDGAIIIVAIIVAFTLLG